MVAKTISAVSAPHGLHRRALLTVPFAVAGFVALLRTPERALPDAAANGSGPEVELALYSAAGGALGTVRTRMLVKTDAAWRKELSAGEYAVTRRAATEFAFANRYWNDHRAGIFRCVCCGNALFRSEDKYESGTGWPTFSTVVNASNVYTLPDTTLAESRTEVLCRKCAAHLGHVFDDGPPPLHLRYCMNSAALRLIPYA